MENYEQKAKAYDEAIRKLRGMMPNWERLSYNGKTFLQDLICIFPELRESEDEKIRKELITWLQNIENQVLPIDRYNAILAWLEKQGQKPAWTEDDNEELKIAINALKNIGQYNSAAWLITLKQRIGWKPSDKQMKALDSAIDEFDGYQEYDSLVSLKKDLEKLKRE